MARFEQGTYAKVIETGRIGVVYSRERTKVSVEFYDKSMIEPEIFSFKDHELMVVELPRLKTSQLGPFVRGEITVSDITNGTNIIPDYIETDTKEYKITVADLLAGLNVYEGKSEEEVYSWLDTLDLFEESMSFVNDPWEEIQDAVTDKDILNLAYDEVYDLKWLILDGEFPELKPEDYAPLRNLLETWIKSEGKEYPESIKQRIAFQYDEDSIDKQSEATQKLFKECLDYFCDVKKDTKAIQKRGYCYYCGTKIYPNDWIKARDAFIEYYQMTGDASAANTLGYIYYYGRCNDGVPEYEEAFKYFSIGHAYTYFESTYKLADMFAHGYGVVKDGETANHLYWSVYKQSIKRFMKGDMIGKFADAALRMGNCFRDEIGAPKDLETAYYYYLQADLAIRERVKAANHYGDNVVYTGIQKALASVREEYKDHGRTEKYEYPGWTKWTLIKHRRCKLSVKELKDGMLALDASPMKRYDEDEAPMMLITVPRADYCELKKKIRIKTAPLSRFEAKDGAKEIIFDHIEYDLRKHRTTFYLFEDKVAELYTDYYTFTAPANKAAKKSGEKYHFASVRFEGTGRVYDYLCEDVTVKPGDMVIINGYDGEKAVEVVEVSDKYESELGLPIERYKSVLRKA
ncbi:MAG: sel1 repeat family protein [Lachnospiraceae bacterium]|nr:sel1 repeat family protein [Candidatus Colinaster scatohippi]